MDKPRKILLVDDEPDIIKFLSYFFKKEGFSIISAATGREAVELMRNENPDIIILDVIMPYMDGIETCRELREIEVMQQVPILFLTARNEEYTQIAGFNAGADDYVIKPVNPRVLLSRIQALLRRSEVSMVPREMIRRQNQLEIDRERYLVTKNGAAIQLRRREFELLAFLAAKPGKVFRRDELLSAVWGQGILCSGRTVDVHINQLREKVGDKYFMTVKGVGYKYISDSLN